MRSPISVWRRMNSHSRGSSGPGLERMASGIATLPMSCSSAAWLICSASSSPRPRRRAVDSASSATPSRWVKSSGLRSLSARTSTALLWRVADVRPGVLLRVHALVGDAQRLGRVHRLAREHDRAVGAGDGEALAALGQRGGGAGDDRVGDLVARVEERAELVAAHPERAAAAGQVGREVAAEADEQRVARGVAEGVVVVLEAVEVEQHEHERAGVVGLGQHRLEVAGQRAAVAEPGQRVGHRLVARRAQDRDVVAEGQHQPRHHRDERERGQRDRERVEVGQAAVDRASRARRRRTRAGRR